MTATRQDIAAGLLKHGVTATTYTRPTDWDLMRAATDRDAGKRPCGYCMHCGYGGGASEACLHRR